MWQQFFKTVGSIYNFLIAVLLSVVLGVVTWGCWQLYQEARLQSEFVREGKSISVKVDEAQHDQRSWQDILGNSAYLAFRYQGKSYTTRYSMADNYVGTGDQVVLLYHPSYDTFRQPERVAPAHQSIKQSALVNWSSLRSVSKENQLLLFCIILATAFLFMASGVILSILPLDSLRYIIQSVLVIELLIAAVFFTYDIWTYFQYYQALKAKGHPETAVVVSTNRHAFPRSNSSDWDDWYDYDATVNFQHQKRVIPISEDDYDSLKPNDSIRVIYDPSVDDVMSADYAADYKQILVPVAFWVIALVLLRSWISKIFPHPSRRVGWGEEK
ncbi:hypothetical protein [Spirosoma gilvum]